MVRGEAVLKLEGFLFQGRIILRVNKGTKMLNSREDGIAYGVDKVATPVGGFYQQHFSAENLIPDHFHEDPYISFVQTGNYIEKSIANEFYCDKGSIIFHPAKESHSNQFIDETRVFSLFLKPDQLGRQKGKALECGATKFKSASLNILFRKVFEELRVQDEFREIILEGLALEIVGEVLRINFGHKAQICENIAQRTLEILHGNNQAPISLRDISRQLNVQKIYIARSFKKTTGFTIGEYQRKIRVQKACELLQKTNLPICEIALEAGFCDQSHLNKVFKQQAYTTPLNYRKKCLAG